MGASQESTSHSIGKRKRSLDEHDGDNDFSRKTPKIDFTTVQVIIGSYERALHGITISIPHNSIASSQDDQHATFSDAFLFNAHTSSIRCLALSPVSAATPQNPPRRILATGGTDERINVFSISAVAPISSKQSLKLSSRISNRNRELGALVHHSSTVSDLYFPSRTKLLSTSYDNTIAVTRVRDWTVLSTVRAPIPKPAGRPSGDTAAPGEVPAGVNAIAVHPSAKLCLSVGQGERCMRLWNLVTGKKAGVLTFDKKTLLLLGEGRWRGGEGRAVVWSDDGEEFAVGFERGAIIYGQDCQIKGVAKLSSTKACQIRYVPQHASSKDNEPATQRFLAMSTEDGRILFFNTNSKKGAESSATNVLLDNVGGLGSLAKGNRIKDFMILNLPSMSYKDGGSSNTDKMLVITGSSTGAVSIWKLELSELVDRSKKPEQSDPNAVNGQSASDHDMEKPPREDFVRIGKLLENKQTNERITCLTAFIMEEAESLEEEVENMDEDEWSGLNDSDQEDGGDQSSSSSG